MKTFCNSNLFNGDKLKPAANALKGFMALLLISSLALTACNSEEDIINLPKDKRLSITVGLNKQSRAGLIRGTTLDNGSEIGITLDDGANTDYDAVNNIKFTAAQGNNGQEWTPESDIVLSGTSGTLYAYYPHEGNTDLSAIPIETASQTDYLYATPVENVNENNASIDINMNHMLTNVNVKIVGNNYAGEGNISAIAIQSDGFATAGTFNAAQTTPAFTAFTGQGDDIERHVTTTLDAATGTDIMVVPTGQAAPITFKATIDGVDYTVSSTDVTLENGNSYEYTLKLSSTYFTIKSVSVTQWNPVTSNEDLEIEKLLTWENAPNGVYAVSADRLPVKVADETSECIAVALITNNQRIMIEKNGEANPEWNSNTTFYWGYNLKQKDVVGITETTEINVAKADFNGKANTNAIISAYSEHSVQMDALDMCSILQAFNAGQNNAGYTDWYIPALGQLYEIYTNKTNIDTALNAMGCSPLYPDINYWSSSENSDSNGWCVNFSNGDINNSGKDNTNRRVRLVRNI